MVDDEQIIVSPRTRRQIMEASPASAQKHEEAAAKKRENQRFYQNANEWKLPPSGRVKGGSSKPA